MSSSNAATKLEQLFEEHRKLDAEWRKLNLTPAGHIRLGLTPEQQARSKELHKQSNEISKQICSLTNAAHNALSA